MSNWNEDQKWEKEWHGNCVNSLNEELKQLVYARKMGLKFTPNAKTPYNFDLGGKTVLDIGGGAYSLLLKCENFKKGVVVDPCEYPKWVYFRYKSANINPIVIEAEKLDTVQLGINTFDEIFMYNVLQHTIDPKKIITNALNLGKLVRIFEWVEEPISIGHPHTLHEDQLNEWLGGIGKTEQLNENGCVGKAYYGIFKGKHYEE